MENAQVGPFRIIKKLGTNRRQKVYHARQEEQHRDVALKFIKLPPDVEWSVALSKIEREVEILKKLQHPNLVQVFGAGVHEQEVFFATELVDGESLAALLRRRGRLAPDLAVEYGRQIASMLEYIHREEILHAKLTPAKVLIAAGDKVKVADLRLNRSRKRRWDTTRQRELETAAYMAPEQFTEGATVKSDFYSLGVILFEMLTGELPYPPDNVARMTRNKLNEPVPSVANHVMNCPIWLDRIISQMLDPDPRKRPHSAHAIVLAFDEIRKIDRNRKAAVSQMAGSFNALNAGADRTEANRLLGKKSTSSQSDESVPFYQRVPFLIGALLLIAVIIGWALMPAKPEKLMERADALMASQDAGDWWEARGLFKTVMENPSVPDEMRTRAETQFYEARRRTLVLQAERGTVLRFQDRDAQKFGRAVEAQLDGDYAEAQSLFAELVESVDPRGDNRHIYMESRNRLALIEDRPEPLPEDPEQLRQLLELARSATDRTAIENGLRFCSRVILDFSDRPEYEPIVALADQVVGELEDREPVEASPPPTDSPVDTGSDEGQASENPDQESSTATPTGK